MPPNPQRGNIFLCEWLKTLLWLAAKASNPQTRNQYHPHKNSCFFYHYILLSHYVNHLKKDEKLEKGKALLAFLKAFHIDKEQKDLKMLEEPETHYNPQFVAKIKNAEKEIEDGETFLIETDSIWESIK